MVFVELIEWLKSAKIWKAFCLFAGTVKSVVIVCWIKSYGDGRARCFIICESSHQNYSLVQRAVTQVNIHQHTSKAFK